MQNRRCFHSDESFFKDHVLAVIEEREPGYWIASTWPTLESAQTEATRLNTQLGLSEDDVLNIRSSSMAAHHASGAAG